MSKTRMTAIEKLAREICWAGFTMPQFRRGRTKAGFWKSISEDARIGYREEAARFAFIIKRVDVNVLNELE